jgi:AcrR family transcriptional regulator
MISGKSREVASRNPEQTKKRILSAALKEFSAHGYAGARVDAIASRARINKRMLYHYFGDKQALFREVLRTKMSERSAMMDAAPTNALDSLPALFELMRSDPDWVRLLQWEALQWKEAKVIDEERRQEMFARGVASIEAQQRRGELPKDLEASQLVLSLVALTAYPFAFPSVTRLVTGKRPSDPEFVQQRSEFLKKLSAYLKPPA